jgi:hypothetical protein
MTRTAGNPLYVGLLAAAASSCAMAVHAAGPAKYWDIESYRIHAVLAIDAPGEQADQLAAELPPCLEARAAAALGALWRLELELAAGPVRHRLLSGMNEATESDLLDATTAEDKQVWLTVRATPWGYELAAREYDRYVQRWSATIRSRTRQRDALPEQLFALVRRVVAPLAQFHLDPDHNDLVVLAMRGASLPRRSGDFQWVEPGEVFLPILRRTTREGELVENGIQAVPWTYIEVIGSDDSPPDRGEITGRVQSGTRRPLGVRRRGRIEQVAIAMRADPRTTVVGLRSRTDSAKPLVGYEVDVQSTEAPATRRLVGLSDNRGEVCIEPGPTPILLLYVESGGELLARLPIVPGVDDRLDVPLVDDDPRLRASARLAAMREDLVDLVARRNIFMARVRQEIEEKNFSRARELLESLDELPGRAQFNLTLQREARLHRASDPQVQRRIDRLFSATQTVLSQFLDPRPISELHDQLRAARQEGS